MHSALDAQVERQVPAVVQRYGEHSATGPSGETSECAPSQLTAWAGRQSPVATSQPSAGAQSSSRVHDVRQASEPHANFWQETAGSATHVPAPLQCDTTALPFRPPLQLR